MKVLLLGLISSFSLLTGSTASADILGEENDTYIGFQVTIPLDTKHAGLMSGRNEYSAFLVNQTDGIRDGIAFTQDFNGLQTIGYMRPSPTYEIGRSRIADYTIPIINLNEDVGIRSNFSGASEFFFGAVVGVVVVIKVIDYVGDEIEDCADPETESEEIAGC